MDANLEQVKRGLGLVQGERRRGAHEARRGIGPHDMTRIYNFPPPRRDPPERRASGLGAERDLDREATERDPRR